MVSGIRACFCGPAGDQYRIGIRLDCAAEVAA
ncbi:hypothetical protein FHU36_007479 [Nonomuraea muscovyensis]|uniref:Uncharacterized protein n=1 Tax=Nonomuraea muscovyensis TaxID=1124761 RepID=A0A7X0C988_9ACTN|nr:hypothetical protein [Nonomuraea muscovyensis]